MKKSIYQLSEEIEGDHFLHYSSLSNSFLILNRHLHNLFESTPDDQLQTLPERILETLTDSRFIIPDECDEIKESIELRKTYMTDTSVYSVLVNTTLDCNLACWYCYEKRIKGSALSENVIRGIERNIETRFSDKPFRFLKLSFFGGEPFMCFSRIKELLSFGETFCKDNDIELIADFTTNATLITSDMVDYLSKFRCHFQITLDGDQKHHNKIKVDTVSHIDTYRKTVDTLREINDKISNRWVALRINFDNDTLLNIDSILDDIDFLDRSNGTIILKKIWQLKTEHVNKKSLLEAFQKVFDRGFTIDYYVMPKHSLCNGEQESQVLFNYDGKVFKCTTISEFNEQNALGTFDPGSGKVEWNENLMKDWFADMQPDYCKKCEWFPACLGPCNRQLMAHKGERICTFDASNLTRKEYLVYLLKNDIRKKEIYNFGLE